MTQYIFYIIVSLITLFFGITLSMKAYSKKKQRYISIGTVVLLSLSVLVSSSYNFLVGESNSTIELTKYTYEEIKRDGKQEKTKQAALSTLISMLKEFKNDPSKSATLEDRFNSLSTETDVTKYVTQDSLSYLYLSDTMKTDNITQTSALTILGLLNILEQSGNTDYSVKLANVEEFIYLDEKTGTAQIPLDLFTASSTAISFEMVYIDGQWYFAPYSFIQSIQLSDQVQTSVQSQTNSSSTGE